MGNVALEDEWASLQKAEESIQVPGGKAGAMPGPASGNFNQEQGEAAD